MADGWYSGYLGFGLLTGMGTEKMGRWVYGKTPALMAQLEIEYTDGTRDTVVTDSSWKVTGDGPIREADLLMGEAYDARKALKGWTSPAYDDSKWDPPSWRKKMGRLSLLSTSIRNYPRAKRNIVAMMLISAFIVQPSSRPTQACPFGTFRRSSLWRSPPRPMVFTFLIWARTSLE